MPSVARKKREEALDERRGERFQKAREYAGLKQPGVALEFGISQSAVYWWERGSSPTQVDPRDIARLYGVRVAWLMYEDGTMVDPAVGTEAIVAAPAGIQRRHGERSEGALPGAVDSQRPEAGADDPRVERDDDAQTILLEMVEQRSLTPDKARALRTHIAMRRKAGLRGATRSEIEDWIAEYDRFERGAPSASPAQQVARQSAGDVQANDSEDKRAAKGTKKFTVPAKPPRRDDYPPKGGKPPRPR